MQKKWLWGSVLIWIQNVCETDESILLLTYSSYKSILSHGRIIFCLHWSLLLKGKHDPIKNRMNFNGTMCLFNKICLIR